MLIALKLIFTGRRDRGMRRLHCKFMCIYKRYVTGSMIVIQRVVCAGKAGD